MDKILYCASCRRDNTGGSNGAEIVTFQGIAWCTRCAAVGRTQDGLLYVNMPSPGRMYDREDEDPIDAWTDCYENKPKKRILIGTAKTEVQRAWKLWSGDKSNHEAKFIFFVWLTRFRPYYLTFRCKGDRWQKVHSWLIQYEDQQFRIRKNESIKGKEG